MVQVRQKMEKVKMIMIENVNQVRFTLEDYISFSASCVPNYTQHLIFPCECLRNEQLMDRGEKIDLLVMRTDKLQQDALKYEKTAKKVKNVYWWKNFKYWVLIAVGLCLLAFVISFMVCGIDYSTCAARVGDNAGGELDKLGKWSKSKADKAAAGVSGATASVSGGVVTGTAG